MDVGEKVGFEKENLQVYQILLPKSLVLVAGSFIYGTIHSVKFHEDGLYSYSSFSMPGSPFVHKMLIHRSMMNILSFLCSIYTMANLPENVAIAILMLLPFFVGLAALAFEQELLTKLQLTSMLASYMGVLLISNPELLNSEMRAKYFNVDSILTFAKRHHFAIFMSISANVFNAFNFLAARSISSQVHPCIETMYIGIVQTLISIICLICYKPSCFKFWRSSYT